MLLPPQSESTTETEGLEQTLLCATLNLHIFKVNVTKHAFTGGNINTNLKKLKREASFTVIF